MINLYKIGCYLFQFGKNNNGIQQKHTYGKDNKIVFQNTYMVAGIGRTDDWNLNEQNVALPMHKYKSGKSLGTNFQKGKTK